MYPRIHKHGILPFSNEVIFRCPFCGCEFSDLITNCYTYDAAEDDPTYEDMKPGIPETVVQIVVQQFCPECGLNCSAILNRKYDQGGDI